MEGNADKPVRIIIWSVPRSISTAFVKCLSAAIEGLEVWLAPYHYCCKARDLYLANSQPNHEDYPVEFTGKEKVYSRAAEMLSALVGCEIEPNRIAFSEVKRKLENTTSRYVLVKDSLTWPPEEQIKQFLPRGFKHVFLIRDPTLVFNSYRKAKYGQLKANNMLTNDARDESKYDLEKHLVPKTNCHFFKYMHELWGHVRENVDSNAIVINAQDLIDDPKRVLSRFCEMTGLPYTDSLLHWNASTEVVKKWRGVGDNIVHHMMPFYHRAITSSELLPSRKAIPRDQLTKDVIRLADLSLPYYNEMNQHRLT